MLETSVWLLISVVVLAILILVGAIRAPDAPGRRAFTMAILVALWWTAWVLARHSSDDLEFKILACKMAWFGVIGTPLFWSLSFITYARGKSVETNAQLALAALLSATFGILALTNDWHHWMYKGLIDETTMTFEHGWLYATAMAIAYSCVGISFLLGVTMTVRARGIHRWQLWALLASASFPTIGNISYTAYGFTLFNDDPTPFIFAATGAFMLGAQLFGHLFVLPPIGRDAIFGVLPDPVIVVDAQNRILEMNPAAEALPGVPKQPVGKNLEDLPELGPILRASTNRDGERHEITIENEGIFELSCHSLTPWGRTGGRMIVLRDISLRKATEDRLAALSRDLEARLVEKMQLQALLREEASRDHLTGLYNRRHAQEVLPPLFEKGATSSLVCVAILDIDYFKLFNDRYGHQTGDLVLKLFADLLKQDLGSAGRAFRWGGEEFLIVLDGVNRSQFMERAQRWQTKLSECTIAGVNDLALTFSGGVFVSHGGECSMEEAVKAADMALYNAKAAGRNTLSVFGDYIEPSPREAHSLIRKPEELRINKRG